MWGGAGQVSIYPLLLTIHSLLVQGGEGGEVAVVEGVGHKFTCDQKNDSLKPIVPCICFCRAYVYNQDTPLTHACFPGVWCAMGHPRTTPIETAWGRTCKRRRRLEGALTIYEWTIC